MNEPGGKVLAEGEALPEIAVCIFHGTLRCIFSAQIHSTRWTVPVSEMDCPRLVERNSCAEKYDFSGKRVFKVGVSFSSEKRTIVDVKTANA